MAKYKYSPAEGALLKMLPSDGRTISSAQLTKRYYAQLKQEMPFHGQIVINTTMRNLMKKAIANRETFKIRRARSETKHIQGRPPYEYWREIV